MMFATVNVPLNAPPTMKQVLEVTGVPESEHELSADWKPDPETCTIVPGVADGGVNVIDGTEVTVKDAVAESAA